MKIIELRSYYFPEDVAGSFMSDHLREAFLASGYEVVVYTPVPTRGVSGSVRREYAHRLYEEECGGRLKIHRFPMMREGKNPLLRAFRYFLCVRRQLKGILQEQDADLLFLSSTPPLNLLLMKWVRKKRPGLRILYDLQDIFPDSMVTTGLSAENSLLYKIGRRMEDKGYAAADKIAVISEGFRQNILAKGVPEEKIVLIPNWVDETAVADVPRAQNSLFDIYGLDRDRFTVCYSGNVGMTQNMDLLLDTAKVLPEVTFVIIGDGARKQAVADRISAEELKNVTLLPFQPAEKLSEVFSLGDCGLVISKAGVGTASVPSKTWNIMSASRPVLASFDLESELDRVISATGCGVCVPPDDRDAFRDAIVALCADRDALGAMGRKGRRYIEDNLTKEAGTALWKKTVEELCLEV